MKTTIFKSLIISSLFASSIFGREAIAQSPTTLNMESGSRNIDAANCWIFPSVSYTSSSSDVISGSWTARTGQLSGSYHSVISPWVLNPSGNITFKHRLNNNNSATNRNLFVILLDYSTNQYDTIYSYKSYTSGNATTVVNGSVSVNKTGVYKIFFSFYGTSGSSRGLIDDISIPAAYYSSPSNGCLPSNIAADADGDGVPDSQDDYPNDPALAFNNYMNAAYSTLMFEDLWPGRGDYDFNDLVVDYKINRITNANNKIVKANATVVLRAVGASYKNGFAFQIDGLNASSITSISGQKFTESLFSLASNGTENGQSSAVIPVFDNALKAIGYNGSGTGVNVDVNGPTVANDTMNLVINFDTSGAGVSLSSFTQAAFNPFLIINQNRGREVHKVDRLPSSLANTALFGTQQDKSSATSGSYYRTQNNHPWVLETSSSIPYMKEKNDISTGYLHFIDWVIAGGASYSDWYTNSGSSYRNSTLIY